MTTGFYFDASARVKDKPFGKIMRRLGQSFAQVHREYVSYCADNDGTANDFGWLYNERPHTGFLAAAAWRQKGWIAIEEHRTKKKGGNGRADLFIGARLGKQFYTLAIEAKLACCNNNTKIKKWLDPDDQDKKSGLAGAVGDAQRSVNKTEVHYRCGVVFVCPIIRHLDSFNGISDEFWGACQGLGNRRWAAFSYVPDDISQYYALAPDRKRYWYPAVGVVAIDT